MKKRLLYIATALFLGGCAEDIDLAERPAPEPQQAAATTGTLTRSLDGAVYNEIIDGWMIPQADPFALENVQAAYDRLAEGRSTQTLSKSEAAEFKVGKKLAPTHYALKIYPKSEEEQWRVEMMKDVKVAYIPFSYSQLTSEEVTRVEQSGKTRSAVNTFAEKSPYTVTYDYTEVTDGGPTGPVTYQLPILYTVWPADKPLPDDLEYVVDYEIFKPDTATQTISSKVLTRVNNQLFSGIIHIYVQNVRGRLMTYDDNLEKNVPLANMVIKVEEPFLPSPPQDYVTDSDGYFKLQYVARKGDKIQFYPLYRSHSGLWKITGSVGSTIPYQGDPFFDVVFQDFIPGGSLGTIVLPAGDRQENVIHRAVNYFFNDQTDFDIPAPTTPLSIVARTDSSSAYNGLFSYSSSGAHYVTIYNNGNSAGAVIGTALHEIGHCAHFRESGGFNAFRIIPGLLKESFASYSGWYLGEEYYVSQGAICPTSGLWTIMGGQHRQYWNKTHTSSSGYYSPLFVDLTDTYNQRTAYYSAYPNDNIQGVPASAIWNAVSAGSTWPQCRAALQNYVGTYYTATNFNAWIADFDYWFAQPSNQ